MILPDDPDFHETGECELREHMPPPGEEVNGTWFEYHNNPVLFVQDHLPVFLQEKVFREKHRQLPDYSEVPLRWVLAEQYFDSWAGKYNRRAAERERMRMETKFAGAGD